MSYEQKLADEIESHRVTCSKLHQLEANLAEARKDLATSANWNGKVRRENADLTLKLAEVEQDARNLLARIHRDGGHHTEAVGFKQSCLDAEQEWLALRQRVEELERSVTHWKEQATSVASCHLAALERAEAAEARLAEAQGIANSRDRGWAEETRLRKATETEVERLRSSIASYQAAAHNYVNEHAEVARLRDLIVALSEDERGLVTGEVHAEADRIRAGDGGRDDGRTHAV